jgi:hypothetical protein
MALSNFQYLWNGLTFGAGTDIQIVKEEGLRSLPQTRSQDINRPRMDGAFAGLNFLGERNAVLTLAVTVTKDAPFEGVVANITNAFQPTFDPNNLTTLQFMYPGWSTPRQVSGRVTAAGFPTDLNYSFHRIDALPIQITCPDPLIYDSVLMTVTNSLATSGTFPLTTLTANASIGATALTVASNAGFVAGQTIYVDATGTETRVVASISGTTTVNITVGLSSAHSSGAAVSGSTFPVNFVLTALSSNLSAGSTALTVTSNAGFYAGQDIFIDVNGALEMRTVLSVASTTTINLTSGVTNAHSSGVYVYNGLGFAPTTGGALLTNNIGNYETNPVFTIKGPVTNPTITLLSTGEFFTLNMTLTGSDTIVIDMQQGTVVLNGTTTRYGSVAVGSSWFGLPPGSSTVKLSSTDSSYPVGNQFRVDYRSAWSWS